MRLTFFGHQLLAIDLDISIGPDASEPAEFEAYQDAGTIASTGVDAGPVPFGEAACAPHFFDPGEGDEDKRWPHGATGPPIGFIGRY